jgi:hypothetical protein
LAPAARAAFSAAVRPALSNTTTPGLNARMASMTSASQSVGEAGIKVVGNRQVAA